MQVSYFNYWKKLYAYLKYGKLTYIKKLKNTLRNICNVISLKKKISTLSLGHATSKRHKTIKQKLTWQRKVCTLSFPNDSYVLKYILHVIRSFIYKWRQNSTKSIAFSSQIFPKNRVKCVKVSLGFLVVLKETPESVSWKLLQTTLSLGWKLWRNIFYPVLTSTVIIGTPIAIWKMRTTSTSIKLTSCNYVVISVKFTHFFLSDFYIFFT